MQARIEELAGRVRVLEDALEDVGAPSSPASVEKCSAFNPHTTLRWDGHQYVCRCGQVYRKDGRGGLMEVD